MRVGAPSQSQDGDRATRSVRKLQRLDPRVADPRPVDRRHCDLLDRIPPVRQPVARWMNRWANRQSRRRVGIPRGEVGLEKRRHQRVNICLRYVGGCVVSADHTPRLAFVACFALVDVSETVRDTTARSALLSVATRRSSWWRGRLSRPASAASSTIALVMKIRCTRGRIGVGDSGTWWRLGAWARI